MQENITDIQIIVSDIDSDNILESELVHVKDIGSDEQFIEVSVHLPVGLLLNLTVTAFDTDCPVLQFRGEVEIDSDGDGPVIIPIELSPIPMVFGIRSEQDKVKLGDICVLDIHAQDASKLVSFVCDLDFDENLLELVKIEAGELLVDKVGLLNLADFLDIEENNSSPIALAFTERADSGESICGSGSIFRLSFRTKNTGTARLEILHDSAEVWVLADSNFKEMKDSEQVEISTEYSVTIE